MFKNMLNWTDISKNLELRNNAACSIISLHSSKASIRYSIEMHKLSSPSVKVPLMLNDIQYTGLGSIHAANINPVPANICLRRKIWYVALLVLNCSPLQFVCIDILDGVLSFSKEEGGNVEVSFSKAGCLMWQKDEEKVSFSLWEG